MSKKIEVGSFTVGGDSPLFLIGGPCVIESQELLFTVAEKMKEITDKLGINYIFKASFDKANRSSINGFRGPGIEKGLEMLQKVKDKFDLPLLTDVHEAHQCATVAEVVDMIQIPAFLARQTDLVVAAAKTGLPVNIKKGQFMAPDDMQNVVTKMIESGNEKVMLCERGSSFGYNNLVVDMRSLPTMREMAPVIFDATHSVQRPGGNGTSTGGDRQFVAPLMRAAAAMGIDGIFTEVHPDPDNGKSDGPNMLRLDMVEEELRSVLAIHNIIQNNVRG